VPTDPSVSFLQMLWQHQLQKRDVQYWMSHNIARWKTISFLLAVLLNVVIVLFFPLDGVRSTRRHGWWKSFIG
jgi:hypothetical protein